MQVKPTSDVQMFAVNLFTAVELVLSSLLNDIQQHNACRCKYKFLFLTFCLSHLKCIHDERYTPNSSFKEGNLQNL